MRGRRRERSSSTIRTCTCSRATGASSSTPNAPFDLVFVDGGGAGKDDPDAVLGLATPGATLVLDDFSADWDGPDIRRERWLQHTRVETTEVGTGGNALALIAVVRR